MKDSNTTINDMVDRLGELRAQIADLKASEDAIKAMLIDSGESKIEGHLFKATVVESNRNNVDWRAIAEKLEPSRQLIAAHTRKSTITSVRMSARSSS